MESVRQCPLHLSTDGHGDSSALTLPIADELVGKPDPVVEHVQTLGCLFFNVVTIAILAEQRGRHQGREIQVADHDIS